MNKKIVLAAVGTIIAFGIGISIFQSIETSEKYSKIFYLDATFYEDRKYIQIKFDDVTEKTSNVTLEILGMEQSFQKKFSGSHFDIQVPFDGVPEYGWKSMPITLVVEHYEFGKVGLKTEVHNYQQPSSKVIFSEL
ncbi:MAG: hypothetical protein ACK4TO_07920 [Candidatus Nitrosotenuis sp.]